MQRLKRPDELAREAAGVPPQPRGTVATTTGTVKYWREEKGYGVIASDATAPWDSCALAGTDCRPTTLRRRTDRPQLKRDPLGAHEPSMIPTHPKGISAVALMLAFAACGRRGDSGARQVDTAFAAMQARGQMVMGVDQYASAH